MCIRDSVNSDVASSIFHGHAEKFPPVTFIEVLVFRYEIDLFDPFRQNISAYLIEKLPRYPSAPDFWTDVEGTDVGRKIFSVMKIIFYYSCACGDAAACNI